MQSPLPFDDKSFLEQDDDTDNKWAWSDTDKGDWEVVTDRFQRFYDHWRKPSTYSEFPKTFPSKLSLGVDSGSKSLLPFRPGSTLGDQILVTKSYDDMFHRLLRLRKNDEGVMRGVVLTGQPGVGKATFLNFMLARLLSACQVVVMCDNSDVYLFYCGQVYSRPAKSGFWNLPTRKGAWYCPIWALIDVDYQSQEPPIPSEPSIWPIQASSQNPARWKSWSKQNGAPMLGMPLWSEEELMSGLCLRPGYNAFRSRLRQSLSHFDKPMFPTTDDQEIGAALEVLQTERKRKEAMKAEENRDEMDNDAGASATDQDEIMNEAGQSQASVDNAAMDNALGILVRNAIDEFGFAPRDVYNGVLHLDQTRKLHDTAVKKLDYSKLKSLVETFSDKCQLDDFSNRVVAVYPTQTSLNHDIWTISSKSNQIGKQVVELIRLEEDKHVRETYGLLHKIPESSSMAGCIFEAIVHRMFSNGWRSADGPIPQPIRMASDDCNPPTFSSTSDTRRLPLASLRINTRTAVRINFAERLSDVTLDSNRYYIPTATNNPLFDSFTIDLSWRTAIISIFQITTSGDHRGSAEGYRVIRKIIRRVRGLLDRKSPNTTVKVVYILVCPEGESKHRWRMPVGWGSQTVNCDHRGDAFCLRVPTSERHEFVGFLAMAFKPLESVKYKVPEES